MTHCKDILASYKAKTRDNFEIAVETAVLSGLSPGDL